MTPRFSVVMPAFDAASTIGAAVNSVLRQTRDDLELIVVDDGSRDGTADVVRNAMAADGRVRLLGQPNRGPAAARNAGIAAARGGLVSMIDSDDLWLSEYLEQMDAALAQAPSAAFAYTDAWVLDDASGRIRATTAMAFQHPPDERLLDPTRFLHELLRRNFVYTAVTIRRPVLDAVGGYEERFRIGEDFELWVRIAASGRTGVRVPRVLAVHRDWPGSLTSDAVRSALALADVYRTIHEEYPLRRRERTLARRRSDSWRRQARVFERRSAVGRTRSLVHALRTFASSQPEWLDAPPPEVAATLEACSVSPAVPAR